MMRRSLAVSTLVGVAVVAACREATVGPGPATPQPVPHDTDRDVLLQRAEAPDGATTLGSEAALDGSPDRSATTDAAMGRLVTALSEDTGDFPSDNFVSNETSYLDVAEALLSPSRRGRAYVGVGPEQNLTYIALMEPSMAYIVDIRRQNMLEHLMLRAMIEASDTRAELLERLTSREPPPLDVAAGGDEPTLDDLLTRVAVTRPREELAKRNVDDTIALMERIGIPVADGDRSSIETVVRAFADKGVDITYSMEGSKRRYPRLRDLLTAADPSGTQRSFLATEESYAVVKRLLESNRVVPVVGDFCGERALAGIGADVRARGLLLGAFYVSNVEQYLFKNACYDRFVANVKGFPIDDDSIFVRVWFDQGRRHPRQKRGHRTTTVIMPVATSLSRWKAGAHRSYWQVVTDEP